MLVMADTRSWPKRASDLSHKAPDCAVTGQPDPQPSSRKTVARSDMRFSRSSGRPDMPDNCSQYEVEWQLEEQGRRREAVRTMPLDATAQLPQGRLKPLVGFARLLAKADAAAIVACSGRSLVVEIGDPTTARLRGGTVLKLHPSLGVAGSEALGLLLSGGLRWCRCLPPDGYKYAALVAAPSLAPSRRLLLVARRERRLTELNLRVIAAYLAQLGPSHATSPEPAPRTTARAPRTAGQRSATGHLAAGAAGSGWQKLSGVFA